MGDRIHEWTEVPAGSKLAVQVEGGEGVVDGYLAESDGDGRWVFESQLRPGVRIALEPPETYYSLGLVFTFGKKSTFTVHATLGRPDGTTDSVDRTVEGKAGNVKVIALVARLAEGEG